MLFIVCLYDTLTHCFSPHWSPAAHDQWSKRFGLNMCIKGFSWVRTISFLHNKNYIYAPQFDNRLLTLDPRAVTYVLNQPAVYEKPAISRRLLASLIGAGKNCLSPRIFYPAYSPCRQGSWPRKVGLIPFSISHLDLLGF